MDCPSCKYPNTIVLETRQENDGDVIRRRRQCLKCGIRVTTQEAIKPIKKRDLKENNA